MFRIAIAIYPHNDIVVWYLEMHFENGFFFTCIIAVAASNNLDHENCDSVWDIKMQTGKRPTATLCQPTHCWQDFNFNLWS